MSFTRRELLGSSIVAMPGLALAQGAGSNRPEKKIRIGIVGGSFGAGFQFHLHPNCTVEAVSVDEGAGIVSCAFAGAAVAAVYV